MIRVYEGAEYENLINRVYNAMLTSIEHNDVFLIELSFIDAEEIRDINKDTRGIDAPTDVLSFPYIDIAFPVNMQDYPYDIDPETGLIMLGEILICLDIVKENALKFSNSIERELAYMTLHGLLHLLGYDHNDEAKKKLMREREETILSSLGLIR